MLQGGFSKASWRGIPFFARQVEDQAGRRVQTHVYPGGSEPWSEDLGRQPEPVLLECYIVGPDVNARMEVLRLAARRDGPGTLVHPTRGAMRLSLRSLRTRRSTDEAGVARFTMDLVEAGREVYPAGIDDTLSALEAAADLVTEAAAAVFVASITSDGPEFLRDALRFGLDAVGLGMLEIPIAGFSNAGALLQAAVFNFQAQQDALVADPTLVAPAVQGAVGEAFVAGGSSPAALDGLLALADTPLPTSSSVSAVGQAADANRAAPVQLLQEVALAAAAAGATAIDWESYPQALDARDRIVERIDQSLLGAGTEAFEALRELRARLIRAVPPPLKQLPQVGSFTPALVLPVEVVAYEIYGDAARAEDIIRRNGIRHPIFTPVGEPLEVLVP